MRRVTGWRRSSSAPAGTTGGHGSRGRVVLVALAGVLVLVAVAAPARVAAVPRRARLRRADGPAPRDAGRHGVRHLLRRSDRAAERDRRRAGGGRRGPAGDDDLLQARGQPPNPRSFTGGIGWIDRQAISRASSNQAPPGQEPVNVADRTYFQAGGRGQAVHQRGHHRAALERARRRDRGADAATRAARSPASSPVRCSSTRRRPRRPRSISASRTWSSSTGSGSRCWPGSASRGTPRSQPGCRSRPARLEACSTTRAACPARPGTSSRTRPPRCRAG